MFIETFNPATGLIIGRYPTLDDHHVQKEIDASHQAFLDWGRLDLAERIRFVRQLAQQLEIEKESCAKQITLEMGKPIQFSIAEVEKAILCCHYYCDAAPNILADQIQETEYKKSFVTFNPLGIILAVMPWNFPFWQVFRALVPNLLAGNVMLLKHASNVVGCAVKIQSLFKSAGFPEHVFKHLMISSTQVSSVIAHPKVRGITLTGSEDAGRQIASEAGQHLKKVVLELGGNDACVVLADADIKSAAKDILSSRFRNSGQVCVSTKRVIVEKSVHQELIRAFLDELPKYEMQDPLDPQSNLGPMAKEDIRQAIHQQVQKVLKQGGVLLEGGYLPQGPGYYYPATLIDHVPPDSIAYQEELFGPVVCVTPADDKQHAIELANHTAFGLGGSVYTQDLELGEQIASTRLEAGLCFVNMPVTSDPRFPFGGIKNSGFGRELSREGMLEFSNIKTVIVHD
jgi:succinate-semialdehyde dehydrogenase/glutarate-semialdehyde dehydrogenase